MIHILARITRLFRPMFSKLSEYIHTVHTKHTPHIAHTEQKWRIAHTQYTAHIAALHIYMWTARITRVEDPHVISKIFIQNWRKTFDFPA